jgi:single-strand DNA-binding protein
MASNHFFRLDSGMEKETSYFDVESWGKLAENVSNLGRKGRGVRVVGRLKQERWQNNEGRQMSRIVIIAEHVEFKPDFKKESSPAEECETEEYPEEEESLVPTF